MEYAKLELDYIHKGWKCSLCNLFIDCIGRPIFKNEKWLIQPQNINWISNKPTFKFCPNCGNKFQEEEGYKNE